MAGDSLAVVVPTIRGECITRWLHEWSGDLAGVRVIVVEDNPSPSFTVPGPAEHYAWDSIDKDLGGHAWIIPRRTAAVCSYGFLKALEGGADVIWNLNDDCYPEPARKGTYLRLLAEVFAGPVAPPVVNGWWNTITGLYPRGYPYGIRDESRPVMIHHGLWSDVPDLDGITQLANPDFRLPPCEGLDVVPEGAFFPCSQMNLAFRAEAAPVMYQLLMGQDGHGRRWGFDRFEDIWAGLLLKKAADRLGWAVTSGAPSVHHSRASDPHRNAELEAAGIKVHETFWRYIRDAHLTATTAGGCYAELAGAVGRYRADEPPRPGYWRSLAAAMALWTRHTAQ